MPPGLQTTATTSCLLTSFPRTSAPRLTLLLASRMDLRPSRATFAVSSASGAVAAQRRAREPSRQPRDICPGSAVRSTPSTSESYLASSRASEPTRARARTSARWLHHAARSWRSLRTSGSRLHAIVGRIIALALPLGRQEGHSPDRRAQPDSPRLLVDCRLISGMRARSAVNGHRFLPSYGHQNSPAADTFSPRWWPSVLPQRGVVAEP